MHIFGLILFAGMVVSSTTGQISIAQPRADDFSTPELQSSMTILETATVLDDNDGPDCVCTPYHMCKSHKPDYEGNTLINIRINLAPCQSYLDVCCNDTKITSTENYSPVDYSKEPNIDQIAITENPSDGTKEDNSEKPFDNKIGDNTKEPNVINNEDNTTNPSEVPKEEFSEKPLDSKIGDNTTNSSEGPKEEFSEKPLDSKIGDNTTEPFVTNNEDNITKPSDVPKEDFTEKPIENKIGDNTKEPSAGQKEENTKEPCVCPTEDSTKKPYDSQSEYVTKDPSVDHSNEVTDKSFTLEQTITTEPDKTTNDHQEQHKCGTWNKKGIDFSIRGAIDGESQFGEFPSMVAIFKEQLSKDGEKKLLLHCGGSLIEKDVILTAAHCVIKEDISTLIVRAGEWDLKTEKEILSHQDRRVSKIVTHPNYNPNGIHNDVALIFTETPYSLQDNIRLICLPSTSEMYIDDMCYSSGWGKTVSYNNYTIIKKSESGKTKETGQYEVSILKKVELPIVPRNKCMDALRATRLGPKFVLHDSFICAGGQEGKDTCKGDGGSPLMCPYKDHPDRLVQVGIVAWGINCGLADIPAAYVDVAGFVYWIKNEIETRG